MRVQTDSGHAKVTAASTSVEAQTIQTPAPIMRSMPRRTVAWLATKVPAPNPPSATANTQPKRSGAIPIRSMNTNADPEMKANTPE